MGLAGRVWSNFRTLLLPTLYPFRPSKLGKEAFVAAEKKKKKFGGGRHHKVIKNLIILELARLFTPNTNFGIKVQISDADPATETDKFWSNKFYTANCSIFKPDWSLAPCTPHLNFPTFSKRTTECPCPKCKTLDL